MNFEYDLAFPIRGLYYDKSKGCLMKLDFFGSIEPDGCYFGRRRLSRREIRDLYGTRHIGHDQARSLVVLMDFFCFSEVCGMEEPLEIPILNDLTMVLGSISQSKETAVVVDFTDPSSVYDNVKQGVLITPTLSIGSILLQQPAISASFHYRNVEIVESKANANVNIY